jgi:tripartite-type tricarboxylate transporter receptor subunit TctC
MKFASALYALIGVAATLLVPTLASAQAGYPNRTIKLVVPFAPGGGVDIYARLLAAGMSGPLGQSVVVENNPGGAGVIALDIVAKSPKDGYTLLVVSSTSISAAPNLYKKLPYKVEDFAPVALLGKFPFHIFVSNNVPSSGFKEFQAYAKANPGKVNYATTGRGSTPHLVGEMVKFATGIDMIDVPYKGSGPALVDLIGGQVQVYMDVASPGLQHVKSGKLKVLAVLDEKRGASAPEVPTMSELGYPGLTAFNRYSVLAPRGTPRAVIERLNRVAIQVMEGSGPLRERQVADGADPGPTTPEQLTVMLASDYETWGSVIRKLGIQLD